MNMDCLETSIKEGALPRSSPAKKVKPFIQIKDRNLKKFPLQEWKAA